MKLNILLLSLFFTPFIGAMEERKTRRGRVEDTDLKSLLIGAPSLKFLTAWKVALDDKKINKHQAPQEILEFIDKIKRIRALHHIYEDKKKFFLNLLNNPDLHHLELKKINSKYKSKQEALNCILLDSINYAKSIEFTKKEVALTELAIDFGADVNAKNNNGDTPLIKAVGPYGHASVVRMLLNHGANSNVENNNGDTALSLASKWDPQCIIQMLKK